MTRESLLELNDLVIEPVPVPEWKGEVVRVRSLTLREQRLWEESVSKAGAVDAAADEVMAKLLVYTVCDEGGTLLFQPDDWAALAGKNRLAMQRLYDAACRLNGIGNAGRDAAAKNSESPALASS